MSHSQLSSLANGIWAATSEYEQADSTKPVARLGTRTPLPVEVVAFGLPLAMRRLAELGGVPTLRRSAGGGAFRTDEGHVILDCRFPGIDDPAALDAALNAIPGVVEHGLFVGMAAVALVGGPDGVATMLRPTADGRRQ